MDAGKWTGFENVQFRPERTFADSIVNQ